MLTLVFVQGLLWWLLRGGAVHRTPLILPGFETMCDPPASP